MDVPNKPQLDKFLKQYGTRQCAATPQNLIPSNRINLLFQWGSWFYANKWCAGQDARDIKNIKLLWDQCLKNISDKDLEGGLDRLKFHDKQYLVWPPNPNQFRELCQEFKKRRLDNAEMLLPSLPRPNISREETRGHLNDVWRAMGRLDKVR